MRRRRLSRSAQQPFAVSSPRAYCLQANIAKAHPGLFGWSIWNETRYAAKPTLADLAARLTSASKIYSICQ
jgi:hypothetical protein